MPTRQLKIFEELRREDELVQGIKVEFITDEDGYVCIKPKELISVIEFIVKKHIAEATSNVEKMIEEKFMISEEQVTGMKEDKPASRKIKKQ